MSIAEFVHKPINKIDKWIFPVFFHDVVNPKRRLFLAIKLDRIKRNAIKKKEEQQQQEGRIAMVYGALFHPLANLQCNKCRRRRKETEERRRRGGGFRNGRSVRAVDESTSLTTIGENEKRNPISTTSTFPTFLFY